MKDEENSFSKEGLVPVNMLSIEAQNISNWEEDRE